MNNRNQQTARTTAPAEATAPTYLNVFTVEEYENNGKSGKKWTRFGALVHGWPGYWLNQFTREGPQKALDCFQKAIAKDPNYMAFKPAFT